MDPNIPLVQTRYIVIRAEDGDACALCSNFTLRWYRTLDGGLALGVNATDARTLRHFKFRLLGDAFGDRLLHGHRGRLVASGEDLLVDLTVARRDRALLEGA